VVRNPPWPRIEVEAGVERAALRRAAEFGVDVAAADRPVPPAGAAVVFEDLDLVAGPAEFECGGHPREACPEDDDGSPFRVALEFDWAPVGGFRREAEASHRLHERRPAGTSADALKEGAPGQRRRRRVAHAAAASCASI